MLRALTTRWMSAGKGFPAISGTATARLSEGAWMFVLEEYEHPALAARDLR